LTDRFLSDDETSEFVTLSTNSSSSSSNKKKPVPANEPVVKRIDLLSRIDALIDQESTKQRVACETKPRDEDSIQSERVDSEHNDDDEDDAVDEDEEEEQLPPLTIERSLLDR
jgi:hypothetical protein